MDKKEDIFYLVWNGSSGYTGYRHRSFEKASKEAKRLSKNNQGQVFFVLTPISSYEVNSVVEKHYELHDEIPF